MEKDGGLASANSELASSGTANHDIEANQISTKPLTPTVSVAASLRDPETDQYGKRPDCFSSTTQECLFVLTATMAIGQSSICVGAIQPITSYIAATLHMKPAEVTWISAASSLSAGCFLLFFGKVADLFGRRIMLLASMCAFSIFLVVAGFATNPIYMDVLSGLLGLCSAAAVPPAIGILGAVYRTPSKRKNKAFACFSAGNPLGFVVGTFISGVATEVLNWRCSFWAMAILYGAFTLVAFWTVPKDTQVKAKFDLRTLSQFDFLGTLLVVTGIASFTSALTLGGDAPNGWKTSYVLVLLILGICLLAAFVYWQSIFRHPLMPLTVWRDKNFSLLVVILCLGFSGFAANGFWLSLLFQKVQHDDALEVAVKLLPMVVSGILVNIVAGLILHRVSNKLLMGVGACAYVIAFALLSGMELDVPHSYWAFAFPALVLQVVGADLQFNVVNMYVLSSLPESQQAVGGGLFQTLTRLSISVGLGISTAVYSSLNGSPGKVSSRYLPYRSTFWVALGGSVFGAVLVPFVTIHTQGAKTKAKRTSRPQEKDSHS